MHYLCYITSDGRVGQAQEDDGGSCMGCYNKAALYMNIMGSGYAIGEMGKAGSMCRNYIE